jgi:dTDP-4-dehydrorhamnose 3,5-epimerase-like enzyme
MTTVNDVKMINFRSFGEERGTLVFMEGEKSIPFPIKRIYYAYGADDTYTRGVHSHHETQQVQICLRGRVNCMVRDGKSLAEYTLDNPTKGLYIPNYIWDEQIYHTPDTILLVLTNTQYNENEYIHSWKDFLECKRQGC